jgi:hypothetical protein
MLNVWASAATNNPSINPASLAAGANNGAYVDISAAEGEVLVEIPVGAVTGSVVVKVQDADDTGGTNVADLAGVTTASYSTANSVTKLTFPASSSRKAIRAVATVTTGPIVMGATVKFIPKIV